VKRRSGLFAFTLIELLLVMSLMGIFVSLAVFGTQSWLPGEQLKAHVRKVAQTFIYYRDRAVLEQKEYKLRLDSQKRNLIISVFEDGHWKKVKTQNFPEGIELIGMEILGSGQVEEGWLENILRPGEGLAEQRIWFRNEDEAVLGVHISALLNKAVIIEN